MTKGKHGNFEIGKGKQSGAGSRCSVFKFIRGLRAFAAFEFFCGKTNLRQFVQFVSN
jgi:hypothetical protein